MRMYTITMEADQVASSRNGGDEARRRTSFDPIVPNVISFYFIRVECALRDNRDSGWSRNRKPAVVC